jgi:hypothetical protein
MRREWSRDIVVHPGVERSHGHIGIAMHACRQDGKAGCSRVITQLPSPLQHGMSTAWHVNDDELG